MALWLWLREKAAVVLQQAPDDYLPTESLWCSIENLSRNELAEEGDHSQGPEQSGRFGQVYSGILAART